MRGPCGLTVKVMIPVFPLYFGEKIAFVWFAVLKYLTETTQEYAEMLVVDIWPLES